MLNNTSTESVPRPSATAMSTSPLVGLDAPNPDLETRYLDLQEIIDASPEFRDIDDFLVSPAMPELDHLSTSPLEGEWSEFPSDFLTTPLFQDDDGIHIDYANEPLFPPFVENYTFNVEAEVPVEPKAPAAVDPFANLHTISPNTPALDSFDSFTPAIAPVQVPFASPVSSSSTAPAPAPAVTAAPATAGRRVKATGTRKGITPDSLLDENAPTQPRKYATPSATSRKEVPAVFARKRSRSTAFGEDEEDELDTLPPNPTEKDLIEQKRRQNTVAARRSRKRKLEQQQMLEKQVKEESILKEVWKERANMAMQILRKHNIADLPEWPSDEQTLELEMRMGRY